MTKLPDKFTDDTGKLPDELIAPGQSARETKNDKAIRYEAQIIAKIYGKALPQALEIARISLAAKAVANNKLRDKQRNRARKKKQRRLEGPKKSEYIYKIHGPALSGGLPGLGKRK
jgi:hypothetical protein